jgi:dihydroxyacetone kinase-like protein
MDTIRNSDGKPILLSMVKAIQKNKDYLGEIDGKIGDGDHGMNMNKGFSVFGERISEKEIGFSEGLEELGMILLNEIGGSMGPIYGTLFMEMADAIDGNDEIDISLFAGAISAGCEGLFDIVEARVGDKTIMDTIIPARDSIIDDAKNGTGLAKTMDNMAEAAKQGRDSTKDMVAKFGRASRLGERSKGVLDAGSVSCCIIITAMADSIKTLAESCE